MLGGSLECDDLARRIAIVLAQVVCDLPMNGCSHLPGLLAHLKLGSVPVCHVADIDADQVAYSSRMIAAARAAETEKEDALFVDPLAAKLAGWPPCTQFAAVSQQVGQQVSELEGNLFDCKLA